MSTAAHGNLQKHLNPNPLQKRLLERFHHKVAALIRQTGVAQLLDAGCGEGFGLEFWQQQLPGLALIGGDFSADALRWGQNNLTLNAHLSNFDIHRLPFADNSFPLVICLEVLEHLPDSRLGLAELARVSSGFVLCSVPHEPWFRGANFLRGKHLAAFGNDPEHLHNYTGSGFRHMAGEVIDVIRHGYSFPWQFLLGHKRP